MEVVKPSVVPDSLWAAYGQAEARMQQALEYVEGAKLDKQRALEAINEYARNQAKAQVKS